MKKLVLGLVLALASTSTYAQAGENRGLTIRTYTVSANQIGATDDRKVTGVKASRN